MFLTFLRHAEAEDHADSDHSRRLTPKGLEQAERVGKFLRRSGIDVDVVLSSPLVRARQTAEIVARQLDLPVQECPWLACGMTPGDLVRELANADADARVLLVGHEPDFSDALSWLCGGALHVRKASLAGVAWPSREAGLGMLEFFVPARLMGTL